MSSNIVPKLRSTCATEFAVGKVSVIMFRSVKVELLKMYGLKNFSMLLIDGSKQIEVLCLSSNQSGSPYLQMSLERTSLERFLKDSERVAL